MIKPTIGRKVWYRPQCPRDGDIVTNDEVQPLVAMITYVWNDRMVNLRVTDHAGVQHIRTSVTLLQDDEAYTGHGGYAQWMPVQKAQAAKGEVKTKTTHESRELALQHVDFGTFYCAAEFVRAVDVVARYIQSGQTPEKQEVNGVESLTENKERDGYGPADIAAVLAAAAADAGALPPVIILFPDMTEQPVQAAVEQPRVDPEKIEALMKRIVYTFDVRPNGSTTSLCHAFLDGKFYLASGRSHVIAGEAFNEQTGRDIAQTEAEGNARDKLWEFEGYLLHSALNDLHEDYPDVFDGLHITSEAPATGVILDLRGNVQVNAPCVSISGTVRGTDGVHRPNPAAGAPKPAGYRPVA